MLLNNNLSSDPWLTDWRLQELEEMVGELGPLRDKLDFKVARLGRDLDDSIPDMLLRAEDHAGQLNDSAAILDRCVRVCVCVCVCVCPCPCP